jgi:hypothetical protein
MKALKKAGYQVAATYFGNDADAKRFRDETKIPTYEWNVADFDACQRGVKEIAKAIAPIAILGSVTLPNRARNKSPGTSGSRCSDDFTPRLQGRCAEGSVRSC